MRITASRSLIAALLLAAGCASAERDSSDDFYSRSILTAEQLRGVGVVDAYDAVARLKSHWLRSVTPTSPNDMQSRTSPVMVYLDGQRLGGVNQLRRIEIAVVEYIQYFTPAEASSRWGFGNAGGAILVSTQPLER